MRRVPRLASLIVAAAVLAAGCGGGGGDDDGGASTSPDASEIQALFASYDLAVGDDQRVLVGIQSADRRLLSFGTVQFRFTFLGTQEAPLDAAYGAPVPARYLPIPGVEVPTPAPSEPLLTLPSDARGVYGAETSFDRPGFWQVEVTAELDGGEQVSTAAFEVRPEHLVPAVGEPAPRTENHTVDVGPDVPREAIDSRAATVGEIPDPGLHQDVLADVLAAGRPAVVVISTPVYCQSQFCGPVTDMVEDLAAEYGDRAEFLHFEVWRDFSGLVANAAAAEWIQASDFNEPWVFVIGADGIIQARFGNVATRADLEPHLQAL